MVRQSGISCRAQAPPVGKLNLNCPVTEAISAHFRRDLARTAGSDRADQPARAEGCPEHALGTQAVQDRDSRGNTLPSPDAGKVIPHMETHSRLMGDHAHT